jgi:hypothetical protein
VLQEWREVGPQDNDCPGRCPAESLLLDGFALPLTALEDGRRQSSLIFVPGDLCDLRVLY